MCSLYKIYSTKQKDQKKKNSIGIKSPWVLSN